MILSKAEYPIVIELTHFYDWWSVTAWWQPLVEGIVKGSSPNTEASDAWDVHIEVIWGDIESPTRDNDDSI
jgi:hypothetical protein